MATKIQLAGLRRTEQVLQLTIVIGLTLDMDAGTITFYKIRSKNGTGSGYTGLETWHGFFYGNLSPLWGY
jgi:hypothetical protein